MSDSTVYLISGAGRGIGFAITEKLSARPNTIVFAGVRTLPKPDSQLGLLAAKLPENVIPVKLTSADEADNKAAAELIEKKVGKIDVVIANAGVSSGVTTSLTAKPSQMNDDFLVNVIGPLVLFQSVSPLLNKSTAASGGKFITISSSLGQIGERLPYPFVAYGASKAAVNYVTKAIHQENEKLIAFPMHPGAVDTDMGQDGAAQLGLDIKTFGGITTDTSASGILSVVDGATREATSGKFWNYDGTEMTY